MKSWIYISLALLLSALITSCAVKPNKTVPEEVRAGQEHYHRACANCHGPDAMGGGGAPSLIQEKFSSANFSNMKFVRTILNGSDSGAMPSQKRKVSEQETQEIIKYIRYSQKVSGLMSQEN